MSACLTRNHAAAAPDGDAFSQKPAAEVDPQPAVATEASVERTVPGECDRVQARTLV